MKNENQMPETRTATNRSTSTSEVNEKTVDVLNSLLQINNDRIEGYERAAKETDDADLKTLFSGMASKSVRMKGELIKEVAHHGGEPAEGTTASGKIFRVWMDLKAAITNKDRKSILNSCEFGEDAAQETYTKAMDESKELPLHVVELIAKQKTELHRDHDRVKALRDMI